MGRLPKSRRQGDSQMLGLALLLLPRGLCLTAPWPRRSFDDAKQVASTPRIIEQEHGTGELLAADERQQIGQQHVFQLDLGEQHMPGLLAHQSQPKLTDMCVAARTLFEATTAHALRRPLKLKAHKH